MTVERAPTREVFVEDAIGWLKARAPVAGASVLTSMPDETDLFTVERSAWERWFVDAAELCVRAADSQGLAIFFQTDTKGGGRWLDKAALVREGAVRAGARCVFHWIALGDERAPRSRAGYSHVLGYSVEATLDLAAPMRDVIAPGDSTWTRGMSVTACRAACEAIVALTPTRTVIDPFCGHGTALAVANALGLDAIGVEYARRRAKRARSLTVSLDP
ncbi:MAG: SAM-dependent methyltransferase [Myxococcales bacterium]|nr:SAM-dependent methyltransferase [Myxococcales bacterium]